MTSLINGARVLTILLDIEGTTTPLDFVYKVFFPYARAHVRDFLEQNLLAEDVTKDMACLLEEHVTDLQNGLNPPPLRYRSHEERIQSLVNYFHWLMDLDRKSTPLKSLQGKILEQGFRTGDLRGQVFDDVPPAFERWRNQGKDIAIFSSGSVLAQKLLFAHSSAGDLTKFIRDYFDTNTGAKKEPESYRRIAAWLGRQPSEMVFLSDVTAELDGAQTAGMQAVLCVRPGNRPQPNAHSYPIISSFAGI